MNQSLDLNIRQAYYYLSQRPQGKYSVASQLSILQILKKYYGVVICRRTLNYHLRALEDGNEIMRIKRHKKGPYGRIQFNTTIVQLQKKSLDVLRRMAAWFRRNKFNNWKIKGFDLDLPRTELQSMMTSTYLKTTAG